MEKCEYCGIYIKHGNAVYRLDKGHGITVCGDCYLALDPRMKDLMLRIDEPHPLPAPKYRSIDDEWQP
jgi:hypothetical protein